MTSPSSRRRQAALSPSPPVQSNESPIARLVIAPLAFLSFLLSLFLVDTYTTSRRNGAHAALAPTFCGRMRQAFRALLWKPQAQSPYTYVRAPGNGEKGGEGEEWVWHTKQRKMLRMEVVDAFELRRWVVVAMGLVVVVCGLAGWWAALWVWGKVVMRTGSKA